MRKRLVAIPYSNSKTGIRMDWSPKYQTLVFYAWWMPHIKSYTVPHLFKWQRK